MEALHVVGAGGIGCAVGYALLRAGLPVLFVETNPSKIADGRRRGIRVNNLPAIPASIVHFDDWRPGPTVLLCTKCYDNSAVLNKLPRDVQLIPIQNGFDPRLEQFGHEYEAIASFVSECVTDQTHTWITRGGDLHIGPRVSGQQSEHPVPGLSLLFNVPDIRKQLFRVVAVKDITPIKYTKLMYNAAISPLAAAAGLDNGQLLSIPQARTIFFSILRENYRILKSVGITLGKVGPLHPDTVAWILRHQWLAGLLAKLFEPGLRGTYCSMAGEIQTGRTELENYTGHLMRLAAVTNTPCPWNRALYQLISEMTASHAEPSTAVLEQLSQSFRAVA